MKRTERSTPKRVKKRKGRLLLRTIVILAMIFVVSVAIFVVDDTARHMLGKNQLEVPVMEMIEGDDIDKIIGEIENNLNKLGSFIAKNASELGKKVKNLSSGVSDFINSAIGGENKKIDEGDLDKMMRSQ
ncbi:MAG: hypothetical protein LBN09_05940 [Clostridioides sp.]|jgi:ABC-type uncharacterized transport system substrate-binding protein|nr:hypothetical protein [Clostridioides sp.]